jgi:uncharacterized protein YegP (UPF0339 family)
MTRRAWLAAVALAAATGVALAADPKLRFEVYKDKQDEYRWRLKADDKNLATSGQGYKAKADCKRAIERIKSDADTKLKFEVYEDKAKEYRFRIKATNGQEIGASSGGYKDRAEADKVVDEIKKGARDAEVVEKKGDK